jgi:phage terminase large subunit-like protein
LQLLLITTSIAACFGASSTDEPVTRWMAANVAVAQDPAGNLKPAKDKSTERIDGIVATIMAIGRAMVAQEEPQPSYQMIVF